MFHQPSFKLQNCNGTLGNAWAPMWARYSLHSRMEKILSLIFQLIRLEKVLTPSRGEDELYLEFLHHINIHREPHLGHPSGDVIGTLDIYSTRNWGMVLLWGR